MKIIHATKIYPKKILDLIHTLTLCEQFKINTSFDRDDIIKSFLVVRES